VFEIARSKKPVSASRRAKGEGDDPPPQKLPGSYSYSTMSLVKMMSILCTIRLGTCLLCVSLGVVFCSVCSSWQQT